MTTHVLTITIFILVLVVFGQTFDYKRKRMNKWGKLPIYAKSITNLQNLERFESEISKTFIFANNFTNQISPGPDIRRMRHVYLKDYYESNGYSDIEGTLAHHPVPASENLICAFRLVRRVHTLLRDLVLHTHFCQYFGTLCKNIAYFFMQYGWPELEDVETLAENILRIQHVYDLDVEQLANGWVSSVHTNCTFNSIHSYEISNMAIKTDQFASAIQWLELAKQKALIDNKSSVPFIEFSLWNVIEKHNAEFDEDLQMELEPVFFHRKISHVPHNCKNATKLRNVQYETFKGSKERFHANLNYWGVCSGDNFQTHQEKAHLFCWNEFKTHPRFTIGPIKMEFLSRNPDIVRMYQVLSDGEMQTILDDCDSTIISPRVGIVSYQLATGRIFGSNTSFHRSFAFGSCSPSNGKHLEVKLEALTGLDVRGEASEILSVLSYSVGGHLNPHFDKLSFMDLDSTPYYFRLTSIMLYLSDVDLGGGTAFTSLGISAEPIKGSALVWFNFFTDGSSDFETFHGGCPVLFGAKLAANKWIRYGTQLKHKCGLKRKQRFQFTVNNVVSNSNYVNLTRDLSFPLSGQKWKDLRNIYPSQAYLARIEGNKND